MASQLRPRQAGKHPEYITVHTEPSGVCRDVPGMPGDFPFSFANDTPLNITCWTESSMLHDEKGRYDSSSWIWVWVELDPEKYDDPFGRMGVGNIEQGGVAGGYGCWMHEDDIKGGDDLYLPDEIRWCGDAPHHQVNMTSLSGLSLMCRIHEGSQGLGRTPREYDAYFVCRNCTDLDDPPCQVTFATDFPGYTDTGCWKKGTAVEGNSTWVALIEPPLENCFMSPDQFDPTEWHGPPAGECQD